MYILLSIFTGGLVALMIQVNGTLQLEAGALPSLIAIHLSGLVAAGCYLALRRIAQSRSTASRSADLPPTAEPAGAAAERAKRRSRAPVWFAAAGAIGAGVVFLTNEIFARGGVLLTLSGTLAGQTLLAHLMEGTRWFDGRKSPRLQRVLSLAFILPGTLLIGLRSGAGVLWILFSWVPGLVLMVQSMMNSRNALRFGQAPMVLLNYVSALIVLLPLAAVAGALNGENVATLFSLPVTISVGGGVLGVMVVGISAYLLNRTSALRVVLGLYAGQLSVGVILDVLSGRPVLFEKVIGILLVAVGLAAEQLGVIWRSGMRRK
ncbi:DMT family transporter [Salinispira pacifica]